MTSLGSYLKWKTFLMKSLISSKGSENGIQTCEHCCLIG